MLSDVQFIVMAVLSILAVFVFPAIVVFVIFWGRDRDKRDRDEIAKLTKKAVEAAERAAKSAEATADLSARENTLKIASSEILSAVSEGTQASKKAEKEANHANEKIQAIQDDIRQIIKLPQVNVTEETIAGENLEQQPDQ